MYEIINFLNFNNSINYLLYVFIFIGIITYSLYLGLKIKIYLFLNKNSETKVNEKTLDNKVDKNDYNKWYFSLFELIPLFGLFIMIFNNLKLTELLNTYFEKNNIHKYITKSKLYNLTVFFVFTTLFSIGLNYLIYILNLKVMNSNLTTILSQNYWFILTIVFELISLFLLFKINSNLFYIFKFLKINKDNLDIKENKPFLLIIMSIFLLSIFIFSLIINLDQLKNEKNIINNFLQKNNLKKEKEDKKILLKKKIIKNNNLNVIKQKKVHKYKKIKKIIKSERSLKTFIKADKELLNWLHLFFNNQIKFDLNTSIEKELYYKKEKIPFSYKSDTNQIILTLDFNNPSSELIDKIIKESNENKWIQILNKFKNNDFTIKLKLIENIQNNISNLNIKIKSKENYFNLNIILNDTFYKNKGKFDINKDNLIKIKKDSKITEHINLIPIIDNLSYQKLFNNESLELLLLNTLINDLKYTIEDTLNYNIFNNTSKRKIKIYSFNKIFDLKTIVELEQLTYDLININLDIENINLNNDYTKVSKFLFKFRNNSYKKKLLKDISNIKFSEKEIYDNHKLFISNEYLKKTVNSYIDNKGFLLLNSIQIKTKTKIPLNELISELQKLIYSKKIDKNIFSFKYLYNKKTKINTYKIKEKFKNKLREIPLISKNKIKNNYKGKKI